MKAAFILYDSDCGICRWTVARLLAWDRDRRLRPLALQDERARALLPGMSEGERMSSWHLVFPEKRTYSAGRAVSPLLRLLPGGRAPAAVAAAFPRTTDRLYRWAADHRDLLGRIAGTKACSVDPKASAR